MPYITEEQQSRVNGYINNICNIIRRYEGEHSRAGVLNYVITKILLDTIEPTCYHDWNEIIGILGCVSKEIYRRPITKYEHKKLCENKGDDVFEKY